MDISVRQPGAGRNSSLMLVRCAADGSDIVLTSDGSTAVPASLIRLSDRSLMIPEE